MELVLIIGITLLMSTIVAIMAPSTQLKLYEINPDLFRKIKLKKSAFFFRGIGIKGCIYRDVKSYGIIIPMFVFQLIGYIIAIAIIAVASVFFIIGVDYFVIGIVVFAFSGCYVVSFVLAMFVTILISKRREKKSK